MLLLLVACSSSPDRVTAASVVEQCDGDADSSYHYLELSSDEKSIEFDFKPGTEKTETIYYCMLDKSGAPSSVDYRIMETRPIDGTQSAAWEGWELYWSYEGKNKPTRIHLSEV